MTPEDKATEARCRRALDKQRCGIKRVHGAARRHGGTYSLVMFIGGKARVLCERLTLAELEEAAEHGPLLYVKVLRAQRADAGARDKLERDAEHERQAAQQARRERDAMERRLAAFEAQVAEQEQLAQEREQRRGWRHRSKAS